MKGKYFKWHRRGYEIVSEALMHPEGDIQIVAMCLDDNSLGIFGIKTIDCVVDDKKHIGY